MSSINNSITVQVVASDATTNTVFDFKGFTQYIENFLQGYTAQGNVPIRAAGISLPLPPLNTGGNSASFIYIRNLDQNAILSLEVTGGSIASGAQTLILLPPMGLFIFGGAVNSGTTTPITAITVSSTVTDSIIEFIAFG